MFVSLPFESGTACLKLTRARRSVPQALHSPRRREPVRGARDSPAATEQLALPPHACISSASVRSFVAAQPCPGFFSFFFFFSARLLFFFLLRILIFHIAVRVKCSGDRCGVARCIIIFFPPRLHPEHTFIRVVSCVWISGTLRPGTAECTTNRL